MYITVEEQAEDQMSIISQLYPHDLHNQVTAQKHKGGGEAKPRRRRKKAKATSGDSVGGARKRKLSEEQAKMLEMNFGCEQKLESERKDRIASELGLDPRQVAVWFQNRRARWKNKRLEDEYSKLRADHEAAVLDKCRLQAEVINMRAKLEEAEKEIRKLSSERMDNISSNSPASSLTMDANNHAIDQRLLGGGAFGLDGFDDMFYAPEISSFFPNMDWPN